ncbi:hypothetical protein C2I36_05215 [Rhodobacteraceae bacterium WD3A24]|nr:hypothetical protein C2I36_05215 [Rhodobacteraceae bacterium WD3A24]
MTIAGVDLPPTEYVVSTIGGADIGTAIAFIEDEVDPALRARLSEATRTLNLLCGIYEEVARVAATHRRE